MKIIGIFEFIAIWTTLPSRETLSISENVILLGLKVCPVYFNRNGSVSNPKLYPHFTRHEREHRQTKYTESPISRKSIGILSDFPLLAIELYTPHIFITIQTHRINRIPLKADLPSITILDDIQHFISKKIKTHNFFLRTKTTEIPNKTEGKP